SACPLPVLRVLHREYRRAAPASHGERRRRRCACVQYGGGRGVDGEGDVVEKTVCGGREVVAEFGWRVVCGGEECDEAGEYGYVSFCGPFVVDPRGNCR